MNCLLCNRTLADTLSLLDLLSFQPRQKPCVCASCKRKFATIEPSNRCAGCSRPQSGDDYCPDCQKWLKVYPKNLVQHTAFFHYDDTLKDWLHSYKIQGDVRLARIFSDELKQLQLRYREHLFVPLPVSATSKTERGFNQCAVLLEMASIPYQEILGHHKEGKKQSEKNRQERLQMRQPFQLQTADYDVNKPVMLFDDLYTTGRTILHAKELLLSSGFKHVLSSSIGR